MKRRSLALLLCALLSLVLLAACGSNEKLAGSEYTGTWVGTTAEYAGTEWDVEALIGEFTVTLQADGTAVLTISGEDTKGTWNESETGIVIDEGTDKEMAVAKEGDRLAVEMSGMKIYFEKDGASDAGDSE